MGWLMGGSNYPQRYKAEVYALNLDQPGAGWTKMPDMPDSRMWPACVFTEIEGVKGIVLAGGYYNGVSSMWLPLERNGRSLETYGLTGDQPKWEWLSSLKQGRKWGAAVGYVGRTVVLAGGGDYGDDTIEVLQGRDWQKSRLTMKFKREFTAGVTVPSEWFPHCGF